jgi:hypothetical protein
MDEDGPRSAKRRRTDLSQPAAPAPPPELPAEMVCEINRRCDAATSKLLRSCCHAFRALATEADRLDDELRQTRHRALHALRRMGFPSERLSDIRPAAEAKKSWPAIRLLGRASPADEGTLKRCVMNALLLDALPVGTPLSDEGQPQLGFKNHMQVRGVKTGTVVPQLSFQFEYRAGRFNGARIEQSKGDAGAGICLCARQACLLFRAFFPAEVPFGIRDRTGNGPRRFPIDDLQTIGAGIKVQNGTRFISVG